MFDIHEDAGYYAAIRTAIQTIATTHHLNRIEVPILETAELFHRGMGDESDVVRKETYTFSDRAGRSVTLRPEGTAGVVRALIEGKLYAQATEPLKYYYEGPMFRYERPQKGRYRQFHQYGVELFGAADPSLDADLLAAAHQLMAYLGLASHLEINHLSKASKPAYKAALKAHLTPHVSTLCADCQRRFETNPLRILDCKVDHAHPGVTTAPMPLDYLDAEEAAYFNRVQTHLKAMDIPFTVNKKMVRGLDYYTGTVFELKVDEALLGRQNTVAGGGRYDDLVKTLGGPALGATGYAFGLERLVVALKEAGLGPNPPALDLYIMVLDDALKPEALRLMQDLRAFGVSVEMAYQGGSMKKQFKAVTAREARFAALLGPDEIAEKRLTFKDQTRDAEAEIALDDLAAMHALLKGAAV